MFSSLARPLPRAQDLPSDYFGKPSSTDDQVISVSHAWRNQAHPDPTCHKMDLLGRLLRKIVEGKASLSGRERPSAYLFLDFVSMPQHPFRPGQPERTAEEVEMFKTAVGCMHEMYLYSDRIIHLPWEDGDVPGEGAEEVVPVEALHGAEFRSVGDCVQVVLREGDAQEPVKGRRVKLFDQVVSVDGEPVTSTAQLESLLASDAGTAKLRHFPFGNYNRIPADARGWVFLERFVSTVKCAMMDEETAKHVIVTPSSAIFDQIMRGATLLREASFQETKHQRLGELKRVLDTFMLEMQGKEFSPPSADSPCADDREVVGRIMQRFVEHLSLHWEAEAVKQRSLSRRLTAAVSAAETYLVAWDRFSEDCTAKLSDNSTGNPWPVVAALLVLPLVVALLTSLWPYHDLDDGWAAQPEFWSVGVGGGFFFGYLSFPVFAASALDLGHERVLLLRSVVWAAGCTAICLCVSLAISHWLQIFPIPMIHLWACTVASTLLPMLWWSISKERRVSSQFRRRWFAAILGLVVISGLFGMAAPLLNAFVPLVSEGWQALLLSSYLGAKLVFEVFSHKMSKVIGADAMPNFVFLATYAYQVNLCVAFSKVSSWLLVGEQICFDVIENLYHLYSLSRQESAAQELYIVASLVVREFVELVAPASFLVWYMLARAYRPRNFEMLCDRTEAEADQTMQFLLVDIATELVVSCATCAFLIWRNHRPFLLLQNLSTTRLLCFTLMSLVNLGYYTCLQHSHWGMDLGFKFTWITEQDATWKCGLTWSAPPEAS